MSKWKVYEEKFDDYTAIINGDNHNARLTIWFIQPKCLIHKSLKHGCPECIYHKIHTKRPPIIYQASASGVLGFKKLKNQIGEFRYEFTTNEFYTDDHSRIMSQFDQL